MDFALGPSKEIVIAGEIGSKDTMEMINSVYKRFIPNKVVAFHPAIGGSPFRVTEIEPIPTRVLGKTEIKVTSFGLGGEGVLRTYGKMKHDRTRDGSLRLLDDSMKRLKTDHLDLWQMHDLRTKEDLDGIFSKGGALPK
jgi:hypothetical protein